MDEPVPVTVRGIAAGGAGVADLPDGRVVFVPRTAPGDRATIRIDRSRSRWAEGSLCELIEPAAERRGALCALYDRCGGCQLQHLPYALQLEWKGRVVADALQRIGHLGAIEPPIVVASPRETGYRSRVTFTLRRLAGGRVVAGFHALGRPAHVVDVRGECVLPRPGLVEAWQALRGGWGDGARLLPSGGRIRLTLRAEDDGVALVVEGGARGWSAADLARAVPELDTIWHVPSGRSEGPRPVAGARGAETPAFTQVNPEAAALLVDHVVGLAGEAASVVDAYSGAGAYSIPLAGQGVRVTAIERDPAACEAARARAAAAGLGDFTVIEGAVEDHLQDALPADLLVLNPPRTGLTSMVVDAVRAARPPRVVYVSCDPATLARDVAGLTGAYAPVSLRAFDLFPQTAHVESVFELGLRGR
jgi:23S rRNA (uracil1939-C5)-methyltransferase